MPGPYSSLMVLRRRASLSGAGRAVAPGEKTHQDNADTALIRLLTSNKDSGTRHSAVRATVRSESVSGEGRISDMRYFYLAASVSYYTIARIAANIAIAALMRSSSLVRYPHSRTPSQRNRYVGTA